MAACFHIDPRYPLLPKAVKPGRPAKGLCDHKCVCFRERDSSPWDFALNT